MWKVPDKYHTRCTSKETDRLIEETVYEAINAEEAAARGYLNCVLHNNNDRNVSVEVKLVH